MIMHEFICDSINMSGIWLDLYKGMVEMSKRVAVMVFDQNSVAYEAFSKIKNNQGTAYRINQLAVVEKSEDDKKFTIKDLIDLQTPSTVNKGGFIGMIVGILGGPLGILFGWILGDLVAAGISASEQKDTQTIFDEISKQITAGQTGLLMYYEEEDNELLNTIVMSQLHGAITRFEYEDIKDEVAEIKEKHEKVLEKDKSED